MTARQYVAVKFRDSDSRAYSYHNDGEAVAQGELVKVPARDGDGWVRAKVVAVSDAEPPFRTKPIIGRLENQEGDSN